MGNIFESATKIILLLFGVSLSIGFLYGIFTQSIDVSETFKLALMLVLGFYFANKGDAGGNLPYLGK